MQCQILTQLSEMGTTTSGIVEKLSRPEEGQTQHGSVKRSQKECSTQRTTIRTNTSSLLSITKCADTGYVQIFNNKEMKMYDQYATRIMVTSELVTTAYRDRNLF